MIASVQGYLEYIYSFLRFDFLDLGSCFVAWHAVKMRQSESAIAASHPARFSFSYKSSQLKESESTV